jgi:TolB-like protein/cytochrome c-type biogenesis protein CcmH/NrfG
MRHRATLTLAAAVLIAGPPDRLAAVVQCPDGSPPPCRAAAARTAAVPVPNSVAVLYLDNLSRDTADAYLADGLTEEIILRLGQIERLAVKSRNAVQRLRGRAAEDPAVLGRTLGVAYLVSGSVRRSGTRLRVTVELVRTAGGVRVWGDAFDRSESDLLAIEEDIARAVTSAIGGRLLRGEGAILAARPTRDPVAYDHLLRGNHFLAQRTGSAGARAIEQYETATRLDPGFADAFARIALAYALFLDWSWPFPGAPPESLLARGVAAVDRALELQPASADAWVARGHLLTYRDLSYRSPVREDAVLEAFQRAIALDPRNAEAHHQYGVRLLFRGEGATAVAAFQHALAIEPERPITLSASGLASVVQRNYAEARRWLDSALTVDPAFAIGYAHRGMLAVQLGEIAQARADGEMAIRFGAGYRLPGQAVLVITDARMGDSVGARARMDHLLREIVDSLHPSPREARYVGPALLATSGPNRLLDFLERVEPSAAELWFNLRLPEYDTLRANLRFQRLVEESRPLGAPK